MEHNAYVSLDTGVIWWTSDSSDAFDEELPDNLETSDTYLAIPHKNEFDLGGHHALRFVAQELPARYEQVEGFFRRQGACARFKGLLEREAVPERWYSLAADADESVLMQWCAEKGLELVET
ncbi:hypothetical protein [Paraburkholderia sp. EG304]|uniref:hypothetical protein n=1 Tax=Paraburkholderia sp. EG304 TaxID=3237015 RepID=UPI00397D4F6C